MKPPGDLVNWCIRFSIDRSMIILKNMPLELIVSKLRYNFPGIFIVHTPENSEKIILRVYIRAESIKGAVDQLSIESFKNSLLDIIIRGKPSIKYTNVVHMIRNEIKPDGSIDRNANLFGIETIGTNLPEILINKFVDPYRTQTNSIEETALIFGIEAARYQIISELRIIVDICNYRHYAIIADEMTFNGKVTSIEKAGLDARERHNVLLRAGRSSPTPVFEDAGINTIKNKVYGISKIMLVK